ncbi:hypothetical protein D3C72_1883950 [compost metagenome]
MEEKNNEEIYHRRSHVCASRHSGTCGDSRCLDGAVRRQLPDRAAQRHAGLFQGTEGRHPAGRGRAERRRQAAEPDPELHRIQGRCDHRQPG